MDPSKEIDAVVVRALSPYAYFFYSAKQQANKQASFKHFKQASFKQASKLHLLSVFLAS
jgi:hypothetical protein